VNDFDVDGQMGGGRTSIVLFALIACLMATDLIIEYRRGVPLALQSFEVVIFVSALAGFAFHWWQMAAARRRSERQAQEVLQGLGEAIDRQFDRWGLTPAEREVALLQLKGLRHKAIAELRRTSERTVRQQALAVYRKSGLAGRSDLAAFFLEDLLLPESQVSQLQS
jgi:DNA-binding CsgD family transcriptional regulator